MFVEFFTQLRPRDGLGVVVKAPDVKTAIRRAWRRKTTRAVFAGHQLRNLGIIVESPEAILYQRDPPS